MFSESKKIEEIAEKLVNKYARIAHVELWRVLFLVNFDQTPKANAKCYSLENHPIMHFTDKAFCIVIYHQNIDYMSDNQLTILILHELMHIPWIGSKLVDHDVKDFQGILDIDLKWSKPGHNTVDILS